MPCPGTHNHIKVPTCSMPHFTQPPYLIAMIRLNISFFICLSLYQGKLLGITSAKNIVWEKLETPQIAKWVSIKLIYYRF